MKLKLNVFYYDRTKLFRGKKWEDHPAATGLKQFINKVNHFFAVARVHPRSILNVQFLFSSVKSIDQLGRRGDMRDDSAEILFLSFLRGPS